MEQPTKEEVEEIRELIVPFAGSGRLTTRFEFIIRLCDAYLALREEVKEADRKAGEARRHWEYMRDRQHAHDDWLRKAKEQWGVHENTSFDVVWNECLQLKAENQALREEVETQQCNIEVLTETKSQHARVIQELQAENQGLERCVVEKIDRIGTLAGKIQQLEADNEALMEDYKEANVLLNGYDKLLTKLRDQRDKDQEEIRKFHADNEALRARVE